MASITLRSVKGSPLSIEEADANFDNINTELGAKFDTEDFTAANILSELADNDDGTGMELNAETVQGYDISTSADSDTLVLRGASGEIAVGNISCTGSLTGNVIGNVTGNLTGTVTGNASNVSGTVAINNGGTGGTTAAEARANLGLGAAAQADLANIAITGGSITGITDLAIEDGGTGASNAAAARTNLGLIIGQDVQQYSATLSAFTGVTTNGIVVKTSSGNATSRSITASTNVSVTNGDGVSGNIEITGTQTPTVTSITKAGTNGTGNIGQSNNKFGTIYGTATSATYADLAEKYLPDADYPVGTVMTVGGEKEITACRVYSRAIGVISENPAFRMNEDLEGGVFVALKGRVPVRVVGPVDKGDELVPTEDGNAYASGNGKVFAIALESKSGAEVKLVEAVIL
jgi:hypothetical protein